MVSGIDLSPLAGIRVISTMIIVCLHRGFRTMRVATSNAEYLTSWARSHSRFAWVYRGTLCVDTFFLLAGLLLAAVTRADRKSSFPNIMFNRALRLLPVYAIVVLFCCTALPDMGEGPLWVEVAQPVADSCRKWWWSNLLFIQNYVNGGTDEPMCMEHSWSLAVDMHLFIAGTLLLRWLPVGMRGLAALLGLAVLATVPLTVGTLLGGWPATPPWTLRNIQRVWAMPFLYQAYVPTHMRAPPYLLGLAAGKALHMLKNAGFRPGRAVTLLATVASLASMVAVVCFGASLNDLRVPYSALASGLYAGLAPFAWSAAIAVLIIVTVLGEPSVVRSLLSWQPLVTLSRLTFPVYLVSYPLQTLLTAAHRDAVRFTPLAMVPDAMSDCVISFAVSFWLFVVVEAPIRSVAKKALSRLGDSSKPQSKTALIRKSD
ncbi:nose resistant to fluoxetine protein 6-like [Frankliniella occidentalis]|uniref:Nose resistant to fluoxetine protein 6-like n=1 Tax=Frankliniella occidentalis TaxID=133901 RepID=A0A6J1SNS7_FRAOC|nr:nose resistant to fluoxetine protein 6-like [Frankliniella occidentalis]